jgi:hypothetical protein
VNEETPKPKRTTLKLVLAGIAIVGVGAAITTAVWTDNVFFSATATASSFDLQGRQADPDAWQDVGIPGDSDTTPITLSTAELSALSPSETVTVPFELCNIGTTAGTVTAISTPVIAGDLFDAAGAEITATITAPLVGAALPSDPTCAAPVAGTLQVVTTAAFPFAAQGTTGTITFTVTGTSE